MQSTYAAGPVVAGGGNVLPDRLVGPFAIGEVGTARHCGATAICTLAGLRPIYRVFRPSGVTLSRIAELRPG